MKQKKNYMQDSNIFLYHDLNRQVIPKKFYEGFYTTTSGPSHVWSWKARKWEKKEGSNTSNAMRTPGFSGRSDMIRPSMTMCARFGGR